MPVPQTFNPSVPPPLENTWMMPPPSSVPPLNFMKFPPPPEVTYPQDKDPKHKPSPRGHQRQGWSPREENVKEGSRQGDTRGKRREVGGEGKKWTQVCIPLIQAFWFIIEIRRKFCLISEFKCFMFSSFVSLLAKLAYFVFKKRVQFFPLFCCFSSYLLRYQDFF